MTTAVAHSLFGPDFAGVEERMNRTRHRLDSVITDVGRGPVSGPTATDMWGFWKSWSDLLEELTQATMNAGAARGDARFSDQERARLVAAEPTARARAAAADGVKDLGSRASAILDRLRSLAHPPVPDLRGEVLAAELAAAKSDVRMLLDTYQVTELAGVLVDELNRRYDRDDEIGVHLLAGTDFVDLYLRSRRADAELQMWTRRDLPAITAKHATGDAGTASALLAALDGADGLPGLVTMMGSLVRHAVERL